MIMIITWKVHNNNDRTEYRKERLERNKPKS